MESCDQVPTVGSSGELVCKLEAASLRGALVALCASLSTEGELRSGNSGGTCSCIVSGTDGDALPP